MVTFYRLYTIKGVEVLLHKGARKHYQTLDERSKQNLTALIESVISKYPIHDSAVIRKIEDLRRLKIRKGVEFRIHVYFEPDSKIGSACLVLNCDKKAKGNKTNQQIETAHKRKETAIEAFENNEIEIKELE